MTADLRMTDSFGRLVEVRNTGGRGVYIRVTPTGGMRGHISLSTPEKLDEFRELLDRAAMPGQQRPAARTYYPCCIHCEHDGESDPDLDDERHPNPCSEGCHAVTPGAVSDGG